MKKYLVSLLMVSCAVLFIVGMLYFAYITLFLLDGVGFFVGTAFVGVKLGFAAIAAIALLKLRDLWD